QSIHKPLGQACSESDVRKEEIESAKSLQNNKDSRILWAKDDFLLTTGFDMMRSREARLWDSRKLSSSVSSVSLGVASGSALSSLLLTFSEWPSLFFQTRLRRAGGEQERGCTPERRGMEAWRREKKESEWELGFSLSVPTHAF
ncbi:Coronin-7, partial [Dissostichus eleginoides]